MIFTIQLITATATQLKLRPRSPHENCSKSKKNLSNSETSFPLKKIQKIKNSKIHVNHHQNSFSACNIVKL